MDKELQRLKPFRRCFLTGPEGDARLKAKDVLNQVLEIHGQARKDEQVDWLMGNSDPAEGYEEFGGMDASTLSDVILQFFLGPWEEPSWWQVVKEETSQYLNMARMAAKAIENHEGNALVRHLLPTKCSRTRLGRE